MYITHREKLQSSMLLAALLAVVIVLVVPSDAWADKPSLQRAAYHSAKARAPLPTDLYTPDSPPFMRVVHLGPFDEQKYMEEDLKAPFGPVRTGVARETLILAEDGEWAELAGIGWLWTVTVVSDGANAVRVHFSDVDMPDGAQLGVRDRTGAHKVHGPYERLGRNQTGEFWTPDVFGDTALVEYFQPGVMAEPPALPFVIDMVMHNYHPMFAPPKEDGTREGTCHNDVMCYPQWANERDATALLAWGFVQQYSCSGTLLKTVTEDETPYLLTAAHCIDASNEANTLTVYWFYQSTSCDGPAPNLANCPTSDDAYIVATTGGNGDPPDQTLLMVQGALPTDDPDWNLSWSGWSQYALASGRDVSCISHPGGTENERKRISFGVSADDPFGDNLNFVGVYWDVPDGGTIEGGSSGSGLFRDSDQLLYGVASACAVGTSCTSHPEGPCNYGRFSRFYLTQSLSTTMNAGPDDGFEDDEPCASAYAIDVGSYTDLVVKSTDEDWYRITVPARHQVTAYVTFTSAYGDVDLELYEGCGGPIVDSAHGAGGYESVSYTNPSLLATDYYLRVYLASDTRQEYDLNISLTEVCCSTCAWDLDINCNDLINVSDFTVLASAYGSKEGDLAYNSCADFNDDGFVNVTDFTNFAGHYGETCP